MSDLERVLSRLVADAAFADALRERPQTVLRGYDLGDDDLRRLDAVLGGAVTLARLMESRPQGDG
jgi:hypothetical protein